MRDILNEGFAALGITADARAAERFEIYHTVVFLFLEVFPIQDIVTLHAHTHKVRPVQTLIPSFWCL